MTIRVLLFCCIICAHWCVAQQEGLRSDTLRTIPADALRLDQGKEVIDIDTYAARFDPRKAILYAAILPGAGQVYNKKYWKVPLVYGGFATGIFFIDFYQKRYLEFKSELYTLLDTGETPESGFDEAQLRNIVDKSKRERDFFTILTGFWYILQLVDAHVDAHLKEFDVNPQLRVSIEPMVQENMFIGRSSGLSLTFKF
ncbi:MAG: DUF5683 domain-containing protein [Cyclobacteriaceae bacterium]